MADLYCYFNSRWAAKYHLLEIFLKHQVAFAGLDSVDEVNSNKEKFKAGTKIAVCDGKTVKAVGFALEDFNSLNKLKIDFSKEERKEGGNFGINNKVLAVKVKLFELKENEHFQLPHTRPGRFSIIHTEDIQKKIDELIKKYSGEKMKEEIKELLEKNKNLILTGAPGTGKTYLAKNIASQIILNKDYDESVENDINFKEQCAFVQFHPSYDYTDFVEGLRPISQDEKGNIIFKRKDGVFKEFCKDALNNPNDKFVFIIDEINRGEISKIFGELFFSVDSGYRGENGKVLTQYANLIEEGDEFKDGFYIPENVYIIGTMNDIDRSVESMDFAMRRRFAWREIKAKDTQNMLDKYKWENQIDGDIIQKAKEKMDSLNEAISKTPELSDAYNIGASYFLKLDNYYNGDKNKKNKAKKDDKVFEAFKDLWDLHLQGLLFEYTRGMSNQETIMEQLKEDYDNPQEEDKEE